MSPQCMKLGSVTGRVGVKLGSVGLRRVGVLRPSGNGRLPLFLTLIFGFLRSHVGLSWLESSHVVSPLQSTVHEVRKCNWEVRGAPAIWRWQVRPQL